ncbi:MAG: chaperone modulator CbpM [Desulfovibrionaceae bacterium]|jgi:hypothetical protein|nr:chaperone modulator CbpM [Desulfovibrionaceae bacterium]
MNILVEKKEHLPCCSALMATEEFVEITGISPARLDELIALGWLFVQRTGGNECLFCQEDIYRVRKVERICCDFELPVVGGTIIVDLLNRIEKLENRVKHLQR